MMKIQLEAYEAASIAELLLNQEEENHEIRVLWAIKLIKACVPKPVGPKNETN